MFLDLRKAFDTLNHRIILSKLLSFNFSPHTLRWIESYLSGRTQYVSIQNYNSAPLSISTGVPQGSILGPLLFTLYINDLPSVCPNTNIQMYADDTVIYIHGSSVSQVANELTESLVHVAAWLEQCCLQLNISKTVCMFITKTKNLSVVPDVFVSGERLQVVSEYKYLGVLIDSKLSFKAQVKKVCNRVRFSLSNFRFIRDYMSSDAALMYMHSMIISHITYCLTTWSQASITTLKPLESLYKQSLKTLDKKSVQFHHCSILKKYNLLSWDNLIKYVHICLPFKTMHSLSSPLKQLWILEQLLTDLQGVGKEGTVLFLSKEVTSVSLYFQSKLQGNGTPSHQQLDDYILLALFSLILKNGYWQLSTVNISIVFLKIDFLVLIALGYVALSCCIFLFLSLFSHVYFVLDNSLIFCILVAIFLIVCDFCFL